MTRLNNITELKDVLREYSYKLSNNYLLPSEITKLINNGCLAYAHDKDGVYIFERRNGYLKLFFHLNRPIAKLPDCAEPLVSYIVHRQDKKNSALTDWLTEQGFAPEAKRVHLIAQSLNVDPSYDGISEASPQEALDLFNKCFDPICSDLLLPEDYGRLLAVRDDVGDAIGVIHIDAPICIAVSPDARRQGIAQRLFAAYLQCNNGAKNDRACKLWSDPDNIAAHGLYKKLGFLPDGLYTECFVKK